MADFGWAFVKGGLVAGASTPSGSIQFNDGSNQFTGSSDLVFTTGATSSLDLSGTLNVYGAINANELFITVTNKDVVNISATGSTKFGDTVDDIHQFTGSMYVGSSISASTYYGDGSNLTGIGAGSFSYSRTNVVETITASVSDVILGINATASLEVRLPSAGDYQSGQHFLIKDEGGNADIHTITIRASGSQTIDGQTYVSLQSPYSGINLYSNGSDKFFIY